MLRRREEEMLSLPEIYLRLPSCPAPSLATTHTTVGCPGAFKKYDLYLAWSLMTAEEKEDKEFIL
jgi:hypothetical protein